MKARHYLPTENTEYTEGRVDRSVVAGFGDPGPGLGEAGCNYAAERLEGKK
jgi:hypothetical protein